MTPPPLLPLLLREIATTGPMPVNRFMELCLWHPDHGYYATRNPLGRSGDFITAPDISQMFGELLGLALAQAWLDQGRPAPFCLAELGPGRGTLMADAWRACGAVPGFHEAAQVHLVEASAPLRAVQAKELGAAAPAWHDSVATLPDMPLFVIANEFYDALPIRQFQRAQAQGERWQERKITATPQGGLGFCLGPPLPRPELAFRTSDTKPGDVVETCPLLPTITAEIAQRIDTHGGGALIVDYGDWRSLGDTLQALRTHEQVAPLSTPGLADLTAHVDFEAIATATQTAAPGVHCTRLTPQGLFLQRLGIEARAKTLAQNCKGQALNTLHSAFQRLTDPGEMGTLFKAMGLAPRNAPPLPGFAP